MAALSCCRILQVPGCMTAGSLIVFMLPSFIATLLLLVLCRIYNRIGELPAQHACMPACHAGTFSTQALLYSRHYQHHLMG